MLKILIKTFFFKLQRAFGLTRFLPINYTFSVSYRCNSRCKSCQIYKKKSSEMNVSQYKAFFKQIKKAPYWITFSGGEPFLRRDFTGIVKAAYDICKPKIISISTNGLLHKKIASNVLDICRHCKKSTININISIDEIDEANDKLRGSLKAYQKAVSTFQNLKRVQKKAKNLNLNIHTVISSFNSQNFAYICQTLLDMNPDSYLTEIAENRSELGTTIDKQIAPSPWNYASAIDLLIHRIKNDRYTGINRVIQAFRLHYYQMVKKIMLSQQKVYDCYAGVASLQLSPDGDVWFCGMKAQPVGNVRKKRFKKIWFSKTAKKLRKEIKMTDCYCPMASVAYTNMLMNYKLTSKIFFHLRKTR